MIGIKPPTTAVPSVNFTSSTTTTTVGQQITLSDTSSNNPTTWSWSVNPSNATFLNGTSNGSKNPDVSFSVAGKYAVTLTASNSKGSGTLTKTSYIIVNPALTTQVCDSLTNIELDDTIYYYTTAKGYVVGNNEYNHKGCAEKYTMPNSYTHVSGVLVNFAAAMASNSTNTLNVNLYANTNNLPGTILATKAVKLIDIVSDVTNNRLTTVIFDTPIAVSGNFYVGVEYNYASGDTVGINHVKQGNATTNTAFVKYSTGNWYTFNTIWNMNQHLAIQALVSTMPTPNFTITSTPTTINTNVTVDASSSVGAYNYLWTFTSASLNSSQYYTETISYPNAGTFNVQLDVTGGCGIVKSITKTVTVNGNCSGAPAAPGTISGTVTVCQGQTGINYSVPSVTGATSYVWTLPSGFTGTSTTNSITISAPNAAQNGNLQVQAVNSCGTSTASTLAINSTLTTTPTFNSISSICNGTTLSPLPTTSLNNYTGTWSPALDNTQTTVYTFTPTTGQCASSTTMTITVNQKTTPTFSSMNAICNGTTLSPLPTTSLNNYTGTWSPALDNTKTTVYTFTPTTGQCASSTTMTITVNQKTTPTFSSMNAICNGTTLSPLPTTSLNNFTGTWSPALDNTQTTVYTFTPTTGQCASNTTLTVTVNQKTKPTFSSISPVCIGTTLSPLPTTSLNNISGTWSPTLDNTKTTIYSFTPSQGQCSDTTSLTITVSNTPILPTFIQVTPICVGGNIATLPTVSTNNITGSWSPTLDNTQTTTYTFTPNQGQCASVTSMIVQVDSLPNPGILTIVGTTCQGNSALITSTVKGGVWSSQDNSIVSVDSIGNISSVSQGTTNVSYKLTQKSCVSVVNKTITVGKCAGIEELSKQNISIFPNPTTSILNLQVDNSNYVKLEVISPIGIILLSKNIDQNSTNLDVANFASGIYLIRLYDLQNVPVNVYFNKN